MGGYKGRLWSSRKGGEGQTLEELPIRDTGEEAGLGYTYCSSHVLLVWKYKVP